MRIEYVFFLRETQRIHIEEHIYRYKIIHVR